MVSYNETNIILTVLHIRFFRTIYILLTEKSYVQNRVSISMLVFYNSILCLSRLPLCSAVVNFSANDKRSGFVRGKEIKNSLGTTEGSASHRRANVFSWLENQLYRLQFSTVSLIAHAFGVLIGCLLAIGLFLLIKLLFQ